MEHALGGQAPITFGFESRWDLTASIYHQQDLPLVLENSVGLALEESEGNSHRVPTLKDSMTNNPVEIRIKATV